MKQLKYELGLYITTVDIVSSNGVPRKAGTQIELIQGAINKRWKFKDGYEMDFGCYNANTCKPIPFSHSANKLLNL